MSRKDKTLVALWVAVVVLFVATYSLAFTVYSLHIELEGQKVLSKSTAHQNGQLMKTMDVFVKLLEKHGVIDPETGELTEGEQRPGKAR